MAKGTKNPRFGAPYAKFLGLGLDVRTLDLEIEIINGYEPPQNAFTKLKASSFGTLTRNLTKSFEVRGTVKATERERVAQEEVERPNLPPMRNKLKYRTLWPAGRVVVL
jgi:hypothetical protein